MTRARLLPILLMLCAVALTTSCGYRTTGSSATRLPNEVKTIAVPTFVNRTQTFKVEQLLTSAVIQELHSRTNYQIVNEPGTSADATLVGVVTNASLNPVTYDTGTGRASSAMVAVNMKVTLTDRSGKILYQNQDYSFKEQYQISREISSFFEEQSPALERLSRDFGRTLVSNILEAY